MANKNRHGRYTRHAQLLTKLVKPKDADAWVMSTSSNFFPAIIAHGNLIRTQKICNMFAKADKDRGGSITFDEFMSFLQNESKQEAAQQKANLAAAANDPNASSHAQRNAQYAYDKFSIV